MKVAIVILCCWLALTSAAYESRGWRPRGPAFRYRQLPQRYGPPEAAPVPVTPAPLQVSSTTTPRSREPTTPKVQVGLGSASSSELEDLTSGGQPAAVTNALAFNRPVYLYNTAGLYLQPVTYILQ